MQIKIAFTNHSDKLETQSDGNLSFRHLFALQYAFLLLVVCLFLVGVIVNPVRAEEFSPCSQGTEGDFVVDGGPDQPITLEGNRLFAGRVIVKNRSILRLQEGEVVFQGNIYVCDSSQLSFERSLASFRMSYDLERTILADNNSRLELSDSVVNNTDLSGSTGMGLSVDLTNASNLTLRNVHTFRGGWSAGLSNSSAEIVDTTFVGEITAISGRSTIRFIRSQLLILWINFPHGATADIELPFTESQSLTWNSREAGLKGVDSYIEIINSTNITGSALIWGNTNVRLRGGRPAIGLVFENIPDVRISDLRDGLHTSFVRAFVDRRLELTNVDVLTWNVYGHGSEVTVRDSQIGESFADSLDGRVGNVRIINSTLTGKGGFIRSYNTGNSQSPPTLTITNCDVCAEVNAIGRSRIDLQSSRIYGPPNREEALPCGADPRRTPKLVADRGTVVASNSSMNGSPRTITLRDGMIWQLSMSGSLYRFPVGNPGLRLAGDAVITSEMPSFSHYTIDYAPESNPFPSTQIFRSNSQVINGPLMIWALPSGLRPGRYIFTLTVYSTSGLLNQISRIIYVSESEIRDEEESFKG